MVSAVNANVGEPTVGQRLREFFPSGTNTSGASRVGCPIWPPDVFAFAAFLVEQSGCYAELSFGEDFFNKPFRDEVEEAGQTWRRSLRPPSQVKRWWQELTRGNSKATVRQGTATSHPGWWSAALKLLAAAHEAAAGLGFVSFEDDAEDPRDAVFSDFFTRQHEKMMKTPDEPRTLRHLPHSLCITVPPGVACVQPKTRTPQVGCTLRSLSHNLALLPSVGQVETKWLLVPPPSLEGHKALPRHLNLLLVPYPYRIDGNSFSQRLVNRLPGAGGTFVVTPTWLQRPPIDMDAMNEFICALVSVAERDVEKVDGVILPEMALTPAYADSLSEAVARKTNASLLLTGVGEIVDERGRNFVRAVVMRNHQILTIWDQSKHHRCRLDRHQICRYRLGDALDPTGSLWEHLDVKSRQCVFYVFHHGASLATLVCEDLARIEPVQGVIRSVGPNLLIALLMDGPQLERRWPGRYATVLADDPGSAVLTLTSLGLIERSVMPGEPPARTVALWKQGGGTAQELKLPEHAHALLLTLSFEQEKSYTLDGRTDGGTTIALSMIGAHAVRHRDPPSWLID